MPGVGTPDLERAAREAKLAARLNHPHVVAVFDLVADGHEHWLVMEYVEGQTLAELVRDEGALTPDLAAPLIRQAAEALAAAHEAGIVHRDVKPSNILVTPMGQVKLTDFGIARAEADATLTQTGMMTGSPAYLAPEIATGATASAASDVWSLGATLFHALAGRPPYDVGDNVMGTLYRIAHEDPPRLTEAGWLAPLLEATMVGRPRVAVDHASRSASSWTGGRARPRLAAPAAAAAAADPEPTSVMTPVEPEPVAPAPRHPHRHPHPRPLAEARARRHPAAAAGRRCGPPRRTRRTAGVGSHQG